MNNKPVHLALVAIGGYGLTYLNGLFDKTEPDRYILDGVVDPRPELCPRLAELQAKQIPIYPTLREFYRRHETELVIISSPIQNHATDTQLALAHGSHVLCEKPLCATVQEVALVQQAIMRNRRFVAIGYQWSYNQAILNLKKDIQAGLLGSPRKFKSLVLWPRDEKYFHRNSWAGKKADAHGNWILDSPINNAAAHYLHNMFYVLGKSISTSARPVRVQAELYRANAIENFDTAALRCYTEENVEILFYASHAVKEDGGLVFQYEFEQAKVTYSLADPIIRARFLDGKVKEYGDPDAVYLQKLWDCMNAVHSGAEPPCGPDAAASQTLCVNGAQDSMPDIVGFPSLLVQTVGEEGSRLTYVQGLDRVMQNCYEKALLPSERCIPWSKKGEEIDLRNYTHYPGGRA